MNRDDASGNSLKPVIGLTGPTGAGKSTVAAVLKKAGCAVVDADALAREAVKRPDCLAELKKAFGADISPANGELDRQLLAQRGFSSPENTERLNQIIHPVVLEEALRRIDAAQKTGIKAVVLDVPLLFECGADRLCRAVIAVTAPEETRLKRIMERDGISREQALLRMRAQHDSAYFEQRAGYVFSGCTDRRFLEEKVGKLLERILRDINETKA